MNHVYDLHSTCHDWHRSRILLHAPSGKLLPIRGSRRPVPEAPRSPRRSRFRSHVRTGRMLARAGREASGERSEDGTESDAFQMIRELTETVAKARDAVAAILSNDPELADHTERTTDRPDPFRLRSVRPCESCPNGKLHYVGRSVLHDGRLGLGGLIVCDGCGKYDKRLY